MPIPSRPQFAVCIRNDGYAGSLEVRKVYRLIADPTAQETNQIRVVDESGEDYLYPATFFVPITLPDAVAEAFRAAS